MTIPKPPPPPAEATWDGKDFAVIQMLPARREQGIPACWVDTSTWNLRIRGYDGVVPVGSVITEADGELAVETPYTVTPPEQQSGDERAAILERFARPGVDRRPERSAST